MSVFLALASLCLCSISGMAHSQSQKLTLYDNRDSAGGFIILGSTYVSDLRTHAFDNRARSLCVTGVWLFYDLTAYNGASNAAMEYVYGNDYCNNFEALGGAVSSLRYAGPPEDYTAPSLTLFSGTYFQGAEEFTTADLPNLSLIGSIASVLVTGTPADGWTLYDRPNYAGNAVCVFPPPSNNFKPGFVPDTTTIGVPHHTIQSVRRGCFGKVPQEAKSIPDRIRARNGDDQSIASSQQGFHSI